MTRVLGWLVTSRPLADPDDPSRDPAAVLHERVTAWLTTHADDSGRDAPSSPRADPLVPPVGEIEPDDPANDAIREIDALIRARIEALTIDAVHGKPPWLRPICPEPQHAADRARWREAVATIAAYRDLHSITETAPLGRDHPSRDDADRRRRRHAAHAAHAANIAHQLAHDERTLTP
jgi:hypothetical protein